MTEDIVEAVAFAIYAEFSREHDPRRARQRFERLNPIERERREAEAKAAIRTCELMGMEMRG